VNAYEISAEWEVGKEEDDSIQGIFINYDSDLASSIFSTSIILAGKAQDSSWVNETISEIEEQIERTIQRDLIYRIKSLPFFTSIATLAICILVLVGSLAIMKTSEENMNRLGLSLEDKKQLIELKKSVETTEQKIDFIYSVLVNSVKEKDRIKLFDSFSKPSTYFIITPMVVIILTFAYLIANCYPVYVFDIGDYGEYYRKIVERRKYLWSLLFSSLIIGIIANLFVFGISESILHK
jgi:hypothetical protein